MKIIQCSWVLMGIVGVVLIGSTAACENDGMGTGGVGGMGTGGMGGMGGMGAGGSMVNPQHEQICKQVESTVGMNKGYAVPGVAGAPRWGIPDMPPATKRVRRSWSTLPDAEKKKVVDAFIALKSITAMSGDPGSPRANYTSFCDELGLGGYERNLYDFYVEAHVNAYIAMMTPYQGHMQMPHKSPQFLAWHRYLLLRLEADMGEAIGDKSFALPYWDWTDCYKNGAPGTCAPMFEQSYLGSAGSCDDATSAVQGYLTDQGFLINLSHEGQDPFGTAGTKCGKRAIQRNVGCSTDVQGPPDSAAINGIFSRVVYDSAPYDGCYTEEDVSFRQYLEGFSNDDLKPICVAAGCGMHGRAHFFIGGDVQKTTSAPNDPVFFLLHSEVDRLWAAWQENNLQSGDPKRMADHGNPGFPSDYAGSLFNFSEVKASDVFDYKALGYEYDTLPAKQ
jgi:tyrosinase